MKTYKILTDCTINKLKELSKSYGKPETVRSPYILDFENEIQLISHTGEHQRTFKKGTKLLISYSGTEISERAYKMRINKAKKEWEIKQQEQREIQKEQEKITAQKVQKQKEILKSEFLRNPEFLQQIKDKINTESGKKWRSWIKMKVCAKVFNGQFNEMALSPTTIRDIAQTVN